MSGRLSPARVALAYVVFSVLALALFAVPLWHAWRVNVGTLRVFVPQDMQALPDLFHRQGADAVAAAVRSRSDPTGREVIVFAGPGREVLAGTLRRWPAELPDAPGTYGHVIDRGDGSMMRIVVSRVSLPGDYHLLMGRQSAGLMSLEGYFWYGMGAAMVIVLALGGGLAWQLARRANAARRSGERFRSLTELSNDFLWETDAEHRYTAIELGPAFTGVRNYASKLGRARWEITCASPDEAAWAAHRAVIAARERFVDFRFSRIEDGEERFYEHSGEPCYDARGNFLGYRGVGRDVTARRRAEEALRESEALKSAMFETALDCIISIDHEGRVVEFNPSAERTFGYRRAETLGKELVELIIPPRLRAQHREGLARYLKGGPGPVLGTRTEMPAVRADGNEFPVELTVTHIASRGAPLFTAYLRDITERQRAEQALRESEERYERAMLASNAGLWEWDARKDEYYCSPRHLELLGLAPGTRFSGREDFLRRVPFHPEDLERWQQAQRQLFASGGSYLVMDLRVIGGAETRWVRVNALCFRDSTGSVLRWTGSVTDVTGAKRAEEALRSSEDRYALAMEAAGDGHTDWNLQTGEHYISPRLLQICGYTPGTTFRDRAEWVRRFPFHPEDRPTWERAVAAHFAGRDSQFKMELRIVVHGEVRWTAFHFLSTRDAAGTPVRWTGSIGDITEHKRAEEALRESEQRYELAMAASESGYWDWDVLTDRFFVSPKALELAGFAPGTTFAGRADFLARAPMHPEDRARWQDGSKDVFAGRGERLAMEVRYIVGGETRWHSLQALCRRDDTGRVVRWSGSATDVTARKLAEEALRRSEARYSLAMEASEEGHFDVNLDTDEHFTSERLNEIHGFPPGMRTAKRSDFMKRVRFYGDDGEKYAAALAAAEAKDGPNRYEFEFRIVRPSGEVRWLWTRGQVTRDAEGRARRRIGVVADVTARTQAVETLRESESRFRALTELSSDAYWVQDENLRFLPMGSKNDLAGYPSDSHVGKTRSELSDATPLAGSWTEHEAVLQARKPFRDFEYRRTGPDGSVRYLSISGAPIFDEHGEFRGYQGVGRDITSRKRAEEEVRESEARFRSLVELSSDWYWKQDEHLRFIGYVPPDVGSRSGVSATSSLGKTRWELEHITPLSGNWDDHKAVLAARQPFRDFEYVRLDENGVPHYTVISGVPLFDAEGRFVGYHGVGRNISERRRMEENLRESEARFRRMTELSADTYWEQDENFRYTRSGSGHDIAGYDTGVNQGKTRWEMCGEVTPLSGSWREHEAVLAAHQAFQDFEYRRRRPDGTMGYYSASGAPMFDLQGRFIGYQGVARDITEFRRVEEELRQSEARFRVLTELSSDWYWQQDEELRFTYLSRQGSAGLPTELALGKARWEFDSVRPLSGSWAEHQALLSAREPFRDLELSALAPDGSVSYVSISGAPIFDPQGNFGGYQGTGRNITERKRIEEELRSRQEMLELAQKSARVVAFEWRISTAGPLRNRWSPELAAMYGVPPEALDGSFEQWKKLIYPEDWPTVKHAIKHALRTGDVATEYRVVHSDGSVHWLQAKGRMFFDAAGKPARMLGFMQDVTQRRQAEEEYRRMEHQLRQAQRLEAMGTLAGGIAHDFNNILGAILGYGEMALRDAAKGSRLRRDLDSIVVAGERGRALVDRVLAFSRSGVADRVPVHVEKVVREALDLVSAKLPPKVTLHAKLHAGCAAMLGDSTQVHQVLMNLATNAIQAMPAGGTLRVHLDALRINTARVAVIGKLSAADYLVLKVTDTGTGIAPEIMERIFDPFFTTKEVGTGTGLGLSLVHGIVSDLGGAIDVASSVGTGAAFTVYLPRSGDAVDQPEDEESEMPRGEGQRVLIVDDEEPLVRLATRTLEELGYAPVGFTSSTAALAAFRADPKRFDAVITDERMPGLSGAALIREVRGIHGSIPIVLMSGYLGVAIARRAREAGAEEVLKKPLSARDLAASLARVLQQ